jgi:molybdate transport system permease protein
MEPFALSLQLAACVTILLLVSGIPLAWVMVRRDGIGVAALESVFMLPMTLPPTVLGFYLLLFFSPRSAAGHALQSILGLVVAGAISALPFMYSNLCQGMRSVPPRLLEASRVLGKGEWETLWRIVLPNMKGPLAVGILLTIAHAVGEFGVVLMIGGSIPGVTQVASIAIYEKVEMLDWGAAHRMSVVLLVSSYLAMLVINLVTRRGRPAPA